MPPEGGKTVTVTDREGVRIRVKIPPQPAGEGLLMRLEDEQVVYVPRDALVEQVNGDYYLQLSLGELETRKEDEAEVMAVLEESLEVQKRQVETGKVRIHKTVHEHEELVDEPLVKEQVEVERVSVNRFVDEPAPIRQEGDTTIIPLFEEVLVVEKRLMLKEEVRLTKKSVERREPKRVTLRREEAVVERLDAIEGQEGDA